MPLPLGIAYLQLTTKGKADRLLSFTELPIEDASDLSQLDGTSHATARRIVFGTLCPTGQPSFARLTCNLLSIDAQPQFIGIIAKIVSDRWAGPRQRTGVRVPERA